MSTDDDVMPSGPKQDPSVAALRAPPRPVVRLNRRMLAAGAGVVGLLVLGAALWSLQSRVRERTRALRQAHEDTRALERVKDRFLSNLSHEMRSPLTAIVTAGTCLRDYGGDAGSREDLVQDILGCAEALSGKLDALFELARLETERPALQPARIASEKIMEEAVQVSGVAQTATEVLGASEVLEGDAPRLARAVAMDWTCVDCT